MKLEELSVINYKIFNKLNIQFDGKSTVIFGVNGTGKSTVLAAINYLFRVWINQLNPSQGKAFESFSDDMISIGKSELRIAGQIDVKGEKYPLHRCYEKTKRNQRNRLVNTYDKIEYFKFKENFKKQYLENEMEDMPIFVNYGTNRSVLDIPDRIRGKHNFDKLSAIERAIENELDFRTFFEWYRDQEANEVIEAREHNEYNYSDPMLKCVRFAIEAMIGNVSDLRVKRNPIRMVVNKGNKELRVDLLSDGEKCTLALFGDLARRLALANPHNENPLDGEGVVLIDEIELHMHPSWQRRVLSVLRKTFPNIQFIITTHSPQVLGEADDSYNIFFLDQENENDCVLKKIHRMDGFDSNMILETYMGTDSKNISVKQLIHDIYSNISSKKYQTAVELLNKLKEISGANDEEYILAKGFLQRSQRQDEKAK